MNTQFSPKINGYSPWGQIIHTNRLAEGIVRVASQTHGGICLSYERRAQLAEQSPWAIQAVKGDAYCPKPMWWEEDCEAVLPLIAFWDDLPFLMRRDSYYTRLIRTANSVYGLTLSEVA